MIDTLTRDLHAEHRDWETDISLWKDELETWLKELSRASGNLRRAERALESHAQALDRHTLDLLTEEQAVRRHERAMAQEAGGGREGLVLPPGDHTAESERHHKMRDAHERLKKYHHAILARLSVLLKVIAEPV
jgi:hypothetical protein